MSARKIDGGVALVTGANRGIGLAIARALLDRGAKKVYAATRNLDAVRALVEDYGDRVVPLALDITDAEQIGAAAAAATDVEILINNAGVAAYGNGAFTDPSWLTAGRQEMEVNVFGTFEVTQAFAPILANNGGGAIANVVSIAGLVNFPLFISYSLSKAALHSLTQATRTFLQTQGTHVIGVYPGPVDTDMAAGLTLEKATPTDVANKVLDGLESGAEEVFTDPMAEQFGEQFFSNPKVLEGQMAGMLV